MKPFLILLLLGSPSVPRDRIRDDFDEVGVNHIYNDYGGHVLDQMIFWNWDRCERKRRVEAWVVLRNCRQKTKEGEEEFKKARDKHVEQIKDPVERQKARGHIQYKGEYIGGPNCPRELHGLNLFVTKFQNNGTKRIIFTKHMKETYTYYDPERENRKLFPENQRLGFSKIPEKQLDN